jgi:hypothetical protein
MSYKAISQEIKDLYSFNVSSAHTPSAIADKVFPELKNGRNANWKRCISLSS